MSARVTVIQCATPPEFEALREAFGNPEPSKAGKRAYFEAPEWSCVVLRGSIGKVWAAASAEFAIARWRAELVIDFGAAGGLDPRMRVGDLVVAEKVVEHDISAPAGAMPWVASAPGAAGVGNWLERAPRFPDYLDLPGGVRATRGCIAAGDKDIDTPEARAALAAKAGAIAATWESSAVGRVSKFHGVPYLSLRAITDVGAGVTGHDELLAEYKAGLERALRPAAKLVSELFKDRARK